MQKIRFIFIFFLTFSTVFPLFSPIALSFSWENIYDYSEYREKINISSKNQKNNTFEKHFFFESPRTTFSLQVLETDISDPSSLQIEWIVDGVSMTQILEIEKIGDKYMSEPLITPARTDIVLRLTSHDQKIPPQGELITANNDSIGKKIVFSPGDRTPVASAREGIHVIKRSEWGADETLRYISSESQNKRIESWKARGESPLILAETLGEKEKREQEDRELRNYFSKSPDTLTFSSITRYENGNKLIWPIRKTESMDRIVIHHTATTIGAMSDDSTLIRAIYADHARKWGDIGYHYIIGQRGDIYEGRAGGDYVEGGHVYGNNRGTVAISVIGNYDTLTLNRDQRAGLERAIELAATKYGINLEGTKLALRKCGESESCIWKEQSVPVFGGHQDYAPTACPGKNIYSELPSIAREVQSRIGLQVSRKNPEPGKIDPVAPEDMVEYTLIPENKPAPFIASTISTPKVIREKSPVIKVRLSYSGSSIILEGATVTPAVPRLASRRLLFLQGSQMKISLDGKDRLTAEIQGKKYIGKVFSLEGEVVRIGSWIRIPSWDTTGRYNDNIFRGKIVVRNIGGTLLVVNELPIEHYLKGMGEVSESVDVKNYPEKVKALIVAARSYGYYYMDKKLPLKDRKFQTLLYDISDNPDESQMYKGYGYEMRSPNYVNLVDATRGEVVKYKNKVIKVWYSSSAGGRTLSALEYCQSKGSMNCKDIPYLQSVDDPGTVGKVILGHGVGVSGGGATYFALQGWDYKKILQYYLKGVEISKK